MAVPYYIGQLQIAARLGYKSPRMVRKLAVRDGLPIYERIIKIPTGAYKAYCISESAVTAWELSKGQRMINKLRAAEEVKAEKKKHALTL